MSLTDKVKIGGLYRHFKGGIYRVTDVVHDSEDWSQLLVVYYDVFAPANHRTARKLQMFLEEVEREHIDPTRVGYKGPRFTYIPESDVPPEIAQNMPRGHSGEVS
jgi:hypothetical protein